MAEHHHTAKRSGQGCNQQPVIPPGACARHGRRGISSESVRYEPLPRKQGNWIRNVALECSGPWHPVLNHIFDCHLFFHTSPKRCVLEPSTSHPRQTDLVPNPGTGEIRWTTVTPNGRSSAERVKAPVKVVC